MNDLFKKFNGNNGQPQTPNPFSNVADTMAQFNQFRSTFKGNPQAIVQNMLNNGMMSNQQFQMLSQWAKQLMGK